MTEKNDSKGLSLATTTMDGGSAGFAGAKNRSISILGQAPRVMMCYLCSIALFTLCNKK